MKLTRSLFSSVAALAIASPVFAQFNANNQVSSDIANYLDQHIVHAQIQMSQSPGLYVFDATCVDFSNAVHVSAAAANITRFDAGAAAFNANTRFGYSRFDSYRQAAWLSKFFAPSFNLSTQSRRDLNYAIWHLFTAAPSPGRPGEAAWTSMLASNAWQNVNLKYWFVISPASMTPGRGLNAAQVGGNQEFIGEVAPEPSAIILLGTGMLGIVGLAARRRKKN